LTHGARPALAAARAVEPASRETAAASGDPIVRDIPWDEPSKATGEAAGSEAEPSGVRPSGAPAQEFDPPKVMPK
jgi:hypothetical protein